MTDAILSGLYVFMSLVFSFNIISTYVQMKRLRNENERIRFESMTTKIEMQQTIHHLITQRLGQTSTWMDHQVERTVNRVISERLALFVDTDNVYPPDKEDTEA